VARHPLAERDGWQDRQLGCARRKCK
jgi:hypothetical protein